MEGAVTNNQTLKLEAHISQENNLRSYATCIKCPKCQAVGFTHAEQKCNIINMIFCICLTECWCCYQLYKKKDFTCYDATHQCTNCNNYVVNYSAC